MPRRGRGKVVGHLDFTDTNEKFKIMLDVEYGDFTINLGGDYNFKVFTGKDLYTVKGDAYKFLKDMTSAKWVPVIHVQFDDTFKNSENHKIFLEYERLFMCSRTNGEKTFKQFFPSRDEGQVGEPGQNTYCRGDGKNAKVIPYTEEAWKGLQKISDMIEALNERIKEFIGRDDLGKKLEQIYLNPMPSLLLEAPKKDS